MDSQADSESEDYRMVRGLPRSLNRDGLPIPYVAFGPKTLGTMSGRRHGEVIKDQLCQVCGLAITWPALIVVRVEPRWWPEGQILDGLIHEQECGPLAFSSCPYLLTREGLELLRITPDDIDMDDRNSPSKVVGDRSALRIPFDRGTPSASYKSPLGISLNTRLTQSPMLASGCQATMPSAVTTWTRLIKSIVVASVSLNVLTGPRAMAW